MDYLFTGAQMAAAADVAAVTLKTVVSSECNALYNCVSNVINKNGPAPESVPLDPVEAAARSTTRYVLALHGDTSGTVAADKQPTVMP